MDGPMFRLLIPILLLMLTLWSVTTCSDSSQRADIVFVTSGEVFTLDPQRMSYLGDMRMGAALYEGLVRLDLERGGFEPAAASHWETSDDGLTWLFHLRPESRWSDGSPVTAHDFTWSWLRLLSPDTAADYSNLFFMIKGSRTFWEWRTAQLETATAEGGTPNGPSLWEAAEQHFIEHVGIEAVDALTLRIHLEHPVPWLLDLLAFAPASPVHRPTVEGWPTGEHDTSVPWHDLPAPPWSSRRFITFDDTSGRLQQNHLWARPGVLVGNGPYVLETWRYKRDMRLRRSPTWRDPKAVLNESIATVTIEDPNTAVLAYETGSVDWVNGVNVDYRADLIAQNRRGIRNDVHVVPAFATDFFSFNCREVLPGDKLNPFASAGVRRAFARAVDRAQIVEHVTRLHEPIVTTLVPPGSVPGYTSPIGLEHDDERARQELADAGWVDRNGDGRPELEDGTPFPVVQLLYTTNTPRYKRISIALREQWERVLGIPVELVGRDTKFYKSDLRAGNFMIARGTWYGDYGDPTTFLDLCRSTNGNNDRGFSDEQIDFDLDAAAVETDPAQRLAMLSEIERRLFQEAVPMIPLCQVVDVLLYDPDQLTGITHHPRQVQSLWRIEKQVPHVVEVPVP
jgi:oligopeptide transport system substrate-binding protein